MPRAWTISTPGAEPVASRAVLEGVRSVVVVSLVYGRPRRRATAEPRPTQGKVARYARGADYHGSSGTGSELLLDWLKASGPTPAAARWPTPPRSSSATSPGWPASAGSARTRC